MIADGRFGKLISIEIGQFTSDVARRGPDHYLFDPEQSGRGFFNWLGCHWLDLVPYLTGERSRGGTARVGQLRRSSHRARRWRHGHSRNIEWNAGHAHWRLLAAALDG